jgi:hypothetical protein
MTLNEIKSAVEAGQSVHWANDGYSVIKDKLGQFLIIFKTNESCIGLTWRDGITLNGKEADFYIKGAKNG